mmetsp:Transcript_30858/g.71287  ORF Transcript_30858/g.71287 Transcript_30858/m.71287 type:complete len:219 (-) Transcript_30858:460-1116(-)
MFVSFFSFASPAFAAFTRLQVLSISHAAHLFRKSSSTLSFSFRSLERSSESASSFSALEVSSGANFLYELSSSRSALVMVDFSSRSWPSKSDFLSPNCSNRFIRQLSARALAASRSPLNLSTMAKVFRLWTRYLSRRPYVSSSICLVSSESWPSSGRALSSFCPLFRAWTFWFSELMSCSIFSRLTPLFPVRTLRLSPNSSRICLPSSSMARRTSRCF